MIMNLVYNTLLSIQMISDYFLLMGQILILQNIHQTSTCTNISIKTQILFAIVFTIRYTDLAISYFKIYKTLINQYIIIIYVALYNFVKIIHICVIYWTLIRVFILFRKFQNREFDTFRNELLIFICAVVALLVNYKFEFKELLWTFSIYLEAVATIPQMYLIFKAKKAEIVLFYYFGCMSLYKLFYMTDCIYSSFYLERRFDKISLASGILQLIFYCNFFVNAPVFKPKDTILKDDTQQYNKTMNSNTQSRATNSYNTSTAALNLENKVIVLFILNMDLFFNNDDTYCALVL